LSAPGYDGATSRQVCDERKCSWRGKRELFRKKRGLGLAEARKQETPFGRKRRTGKDKKGLSFQNTKKSTGRGGSCCLQNGGTFREKGGTGGGRRQRQEEKSSHEKKKSEPRNKQQKQKDFPSPQQKKKKILKVPQKEKRGEARKGPNA